MHTMYAVNNQIELLYAASINCYYASSLRVTKDSNKSSTDALQLPTSYAET